MIPKPNSQLTHVLYRLIESINGISERDFEYNGFRARISNLREHLNIKNTDKKFVNIFGHASSYKVHWLTNSEKRKAIRLYFKLIRQK